MATMLPRVPVLAILALCNSNSMRTTAVRQTHMKHWSKLTKECHRTIGNLPGMYKSAPYL